MTTRQKLESMLVDCGMFESQAKEVIERSIPEIEKLTPDYKITWDLPDSGYSDMIYNLWFIPVKRVALRWIDKNCPNAWFRPMFDDKQLEKMKSEPIINSKLRTFEDQKRIMEEAEKHAPSSRSHHNDQSIAIPEVPGAVYVKLDRYNRPLAKKKTKKNPTVKFQYRKGYAIVNGVAKESKKISSSTYKK